MVDGGHGWPGWPSCGVAGAPPQPREHVLARSRRAWRVGQWPRRGPPVVWLGRNAPGAPGPDAKTAELRPPYCVAGAPPQTRELLFAPTSRRLRFSNLSQKNLIPELSGVPPAHID